MRILLCLAAACAWSLAAAAAKDQVPERFELQLPDGQAIAFRAVWLGIDGTRLFDARRIQLGSREPAPRYKERRVETLLSGGFVAPRNGRPDWLYYLGETEVTEAQWGAVMGWLDGQEGRAPQPATVSRLPKTGVTQAEIQRFVEALNTWMLAEQRAQLPRWRGALAFARLPTEAEWVFAARGGLPTLEGDPDVFDRPHPYGDALADHEWFRETSGNRLQEAGSTYLKPNPLGLRDMLGNVEELTLSLFGPEYQQGRFGQLAICGGNYSTGRADLSAALRTESLSHDEQGGLMRPAKVGLRLALTTRISSVQATPDELDRELDGYLERRGLTRPAPVGQSSPATQADEDQVYFLDDRLARMRSDLERCTAERERLAAEGSGAASDAALRLADLERRHRDLESNEERLKSETQTARTQTERCLDDLAEERRKTGDRQLDLDAAGRRCAEGLARCERDLAGAIARESSARRDLDLALAQRRALEERLAPLEGQPARPAFGMVSGADPSQALLRDLGRKEQEIADLRRRIAQFDHEIAKNAGRVRAVEKRYIEALMRQASANASLGWERLDRWSHEYTDDDRRDPVLKRRVFDAGEGYVSDYLTLVRQIADETMAELFPEVKAELADWLTARNKPQQRKTLDLLERHVREIRSGRPMRLEDLVESFADAPEMR